MDTCKCSPYKTVSSYIKLSSHRSHQPCREFSEHPRCAMDLSVLDPALFVPQIQHTLPGSPQVHQDVLLAESLNNQPRLPNQIGGVTAASVHSHNSLPDPYTSLSHLQDSDQTSAAATIPYGCAALQQNNGIDLRIQHPYQSHQGIPSHHESFAAASQSTVCSASPHIQASQSTYTTTRSRRNKEERMTEFPKFHCGELGCKFYRTDGTNHNGRYAMAKHYKQSHSDLRFDSKRLVSSHTGQKSYRMSPRSEPTRNETARVPSPKHTKLAQVQHVPIDPALLVASAPDIPQYAHNHSIKVKSALPQNYRHIPASLPSLTERPFTSVPNLHLSEKELKSSTRAIRNNCDVEMLKVRKLLLHHCRMTGQSTEQFLAMRIYFFTIWVQKARDYITHNAGPFDPTFPEVGAYNDLVVEVGTMFFFAIQRCHLPRDSIMPDGATLDQDEIKRRKLCCELQAIKLCFEFCQTMSGNCGRMCHSYRMPSKGEAISRGAI